MYTYDIYALTTLTFIMDSSNDCLTPLQLPYSISSKKCEQNLWSTKYGYYVHT